MLNHASDTGHSYRLSKYGDTLYFTWRKQNPALKHAEDSDVVFVSTVWCYMDVQKVAAASVPWELDTHCSFFWLNDTNAPLI